MRLEFDPNGWEDLQYWKRTDRKKLAKIMRLLASAREHPFEGIGKPEPLQYELSGCWSRRIDKQHRLVYRMEYDAVIVISCRYHD